MTLRSEISKSLPQAAVILCLGFVVLGPAPLGAQTSDGETPTVESVCDDEPNNLRGLCIAYCEAMDCDFAGHNSADKACEQVLANYRKKSGGLDPPCSEVCDGIDNDGDGDIDEGFDVDGDGVARCCTNEPFFVTLDSTFQKILSYVSNGDGTFTPGLTPVAELASEQLRFNSVGDFNADGTIDVLWWGLSTRDRYLSVCEGGEWQAIPTGKWTYNYAGGADLDGDGCLDQNGWDMSCCFMSGPVIGPGIPALGVTALGDCAGGFTEVYGTFDPSAVLGAWQAQRVYNLEDANGDGKPDQIFLEYASGGASTSILYLAEGLGTGAYMSPVNIGSAPNQPQNFGDMGDIDGDGRTDWVGGSDDDANRGLVLAMYGNGFGGFSAPSPLVDNCVGCPGSGTGHGRGHSRLHDWDGDGDLDLLTSYIVNTGSSATILYWENDGSGNFTGPTTVVPPAALRNISFATPLRN